MSTEDNFFYFIPFRPPPVASNFSYKHRALYCKVFSILCGDINYLHHCVTCGPFWLTEINWLAVNCMQLTAVVAAAARWCELWTRKMGIKYELFMRRKWEIKCVYVYALIYLFDDTVWRQFIYFYRSLLLFYIF